MNYSYLFHSGKGLMNKIIYFLVSSNVKRTKFISHSVRIFVSQFLNEKVRCSL